MPTEAVRRAVTARYREQVARHRAAAAVAVTASWDGLGSYNDTDLPAFVERVEPALSGIKAATVALSTAVVSLLLDTAPPAIPSAAVTTVPDLRRPFTAAWHALSMGRPFEEAVQVGRSVSEAAAFDFVQSTARRTGDVVAQATGRDLRWRREPDGDACAWCIDVAGQTYATAESADFGHERDGCIVVPAA